jgi:hypothetical protein
LPNEIKSQITIPALTVGVSHGKAGYRVRLEGAVVPDKKRSIAFIQTLFAHLKLPQATRVDLYGWLQQDDFPAWHATVNIPASESAAAVAADIEDVSSNTADFDGIVTAEEQQVLETILTVLSVRNNDDIPQGAATVAQRIRDQFQPAT